MNKKEYALALSGGGTRGAYEVGAYKALLELGINIKAITGTSIGALNGAMFLSTDIFHGTTIASASVAAHEVGHAIQDKENYSYMRLRHSLFPIVNFCSYAGYIAILIGIFFASAKLMWIGIALELVILFFQVVTLPVEFDASRRAEQELLKCKLLDKSEVDDAKKVLGAAAFTYVASVLTTLFQIFRLILSASRRD